MAATAARRPSRCAFMYRMGLYRFGLLEADPFHWVKSAEMDNYNVEAVHLLL